MAKDQRGGKPQAKTEKNAQLRRFAGGGALIVLGIAMIVFSVVASSQTPPTDTPTDAAVIDTTHSTEETATEATQATVVTEQTTATEETLPTEETVSTEESVWEEETTVTEETVPTEETTVTETTVTTQATPVHYEGDGVWNTILVNPQNAWTEAELDAQSDIVWYSGSESVDSRIVDALNAMLSDGAQYGLWVCSGYRPYSTQEILYQREVNEVMAAQGCSEEVAQAIAATVVARPGTSEHHTGLAVDLLHSECGELEEYWDQSAAFDWMMEHCAEYGFILRYPKDKQHITGVIYEPWHYRFVGVEAATAIMNSGITLEEYLQG